MRPLRLERPLTLFWTIIPGDLFVTIAGTGTKFALRYNFARAAGVRRDSSAVRVRKWL